MTTDIGTALDAWVLTAQNTPFESRREAAPPPDSGEALVEVAGCGVCHTDLSFVYHGIRTRAPLPLVLGHEISGVVRSVGKGADRGLVGRPVVIPAVLPCGECELCRAGHRRICRHQVMPGNDRDGGFASHVLVPARYLCPVPEAALATHELWELAVVADAVSTPFQAVKLSDLSAGQLAVFVGTGGIGVHGVQVAAATGAVVIAVDVDDAKLERARAAGARGTVNARGLSVKELRKAVRGEAERLGAPPFLWRIFETSGTRAGQEAAFGLLGHGAALAVVGYTMDRVEIGLSNLMAFDAVARGNWGADPLVYPELLDWIAAGRIQVRPFVESFPLDRINEVFQKAHAGELVKRAVLVPA